MRFWLILLFLTALHTPSVAEPKQYLYLSDQRIVTLELVDSESLILNYINLSDNFEVIVAYQIVLVGSDGQVIRGHLFRVEDSPDPADPFRVTELVKPGQFLGFLVSGKFEPKVPIQKVLFKVSSRILELEPLEDKQFELVAARIGELDLQMADRKRAIQLAGFSRGFGELHFSGSEEASALDVYFRSLDIIPPIDLASPAPRLPSSESHLSDPVVVRVKAVVSRSGGLRNIEAAEGLNEKLDAIAVQTVRNSWVFLPAISENEVVEAEVTLNVVFKR